MPRPEFWLKFDGVDVENRIHWNAGDLVTKFEGRICTDEAKTQFLNLEGHKVQVIISEDFPYNRTLTRDVTNVANQDVNTGMFEFTFQAGQLPITGDWKIEMILKIGNTEIGITHHEDFVVD